MSAGHVTPEDRAAHERVVLLDRLIVVALVVAGVVLSALGDSEHATMVLGGALGALAPLASRNPSGAARILPLVLGFGAMTLIGCGAGSAELRRGTCTAADVVCQAAERFCEPAPEGETP